MQNILLIHFLINFLSFIIIMDNNLVNIVSGPINILRLEGKIGDINKVLFVFVDVHVHRQLKCRELNSIDIDKYFYREFKKQKNRVDFFFEMSPDWLIKPKFSKFKNRYIEEVANMFNSSFKINMKKNEIQKSDIFPNVRLHYLDVRMYIKNGIDTAIQKFLNFVTEIYHNEIIAQNDFIFLLDGCNILGSRMKVLYDLFYGKGNKIIKKYPTIQPSEALQRFTDKDYLNKSAELVNKMKSIYSNKHVQIGVNKIINGLLKDHFDNFFKTLEDLILFLKKSAKFVNYKEDELVKINDYYGSNYFFLAQPDIFDDIIHSLKQKTEKIRAAYARITVLIMDIYFARRFLDKNYVANGITYSGAHHSLNNLFTLIKYFDFHITHAHYMKGNKNEFMKKVQNAENLCGLLEYITPPEFIQCVNMSEFPELFK